MAIFLDVDGIALNDDDRAVLQNPWVGGVILFAKNITNPAQVRQLTDSIRTIRPNLIICVDQEGGRVARLRTGFTPLPAMGQMGKLYDKDTHKAKELAYAVGYVMACEVLAVGIDLSFAPVLDIDNGSLVIGDRAFSQDVATASYLGSAFISGMQKAGMAATGKHFPGHGTVIPDSHTDDAKDERTLDQIKVQDMRVFCDNLSKLQAIMPAHVVFSAVDDQPVGFSKKWLGAILRGELGFGGVIFSDDLSMKAAHVAGTMGERVNQALGAGCDVALVCNDRLGAKQALAAIAHTKYPTQNPRLATIKATIPNWQGDLAQTCQQFGDYKRLRCLVADFTTSKQ